MILLNGGAIMKNYSELIKQNEYMRKVPDWNIDKEHYLSLLNNSTPEKTDFIRVSSVVALPSIFYNFKLQTKNQCAYFCICSALGDTDQLWAFMELATIGKDKVLYYESEQEGPVSILRIEHVDSETLRFTLISNEWLEHKWHNKKETVQVNWTKFPEGGYGINLDIIINKKDFIYAFYLELWNIFSGTDSIEVEPYTASNKIAQADSEIIKNYLGYLPATKLDKELYDAIKNNNKENIMILLRKGANLNAIIDEEDGDTIFEEFLNYYCDDTYTREFNKRCPSEDVSDEESDAIEEKMLDFRSNLEKEYLELIKLFISYGARTRSFFPAIYNFGRNIENIKYLLDFNCVFDMDTLGFVSTDSQICETEDKFYTQIEKLFFEYLFSCSYKLDSESDIIFHKPPEYYYWKGKKYETKKDWATGNGKSTY